VLTDVARCRLERPRRHDRRDARRSTSRPTSLLLAAYVGTLFLPGAQGRARAMPTIPAGPTPHPRPQLQKDAGVTFHADRRGHLAAHRVRRPDGRSILDLRDPRRLRPRRRHPDGRVDRPEERDRMVASIGPFWDANETWLVLSVGLLLVAFPVAHGIILSALYLPVALMLLGLIAARRRLRVPRQGARPQGDLGPGVLRRLALTSR
jgi:hypothetical protein